MGMAMFVLHFSYLTGPYPWNVGNICFTFLLYVIALCVMYVCMYVCIYVCACVCDRALCMTSHECFWPYGMSMRSSRLLQMHIHVILCAWSPLSNRPDPCHQVTSISLCMHHVSTCLMLWGALAHPSTSMLARAVYTSTKPCRCDIVHQTRNFA